MKAPPFTSGYVRFLTRHQDVIHFNLGNTTAAIDTFIENTRTILNAPDYRPDLPSVKRAGLDLLFSSARFADKVFLRHLNLRLRQCYRVRQSNRMEIVTQVVELLKADVPLHILRTDISRFFHNIDFKSLCDQIACDGYLTSREADCLNGIAEHTTHIQGSGLPWGLPISSTLSELYLRGFDSSVKSTQGVYYYHRFVDDIIVFSAQPARETLQAIADALPKQLSLNDSKTIAIDEPFKEPPKTEFNYLGFHFKRSPRSPDLEIRIAENKVSRLKTRIRRSFKEFHRDRDWGLLFKRLQFLTGNCSIKKSAHEAPIRTGIYYNYSLITHKEHLIALTLFLRQQIAGVRSHSRRTHQIVDPRLLHRLFKLCFLHGHESRITHRFSTAELEKLTAAWKYVA